MGELNNKLKKRIRLIDDIKNHIETNMPLDEIEELHEMIVKNKNGCRMFKDFKKRCTFYKEWKKENEKSNN